MTASPSDYQVVIVGSGPAGVSVALPLAEAGLRVLMLDASGDEKLPAAPRGTISEIRAGTARNPAVWRLPSLIEPGKDISPKLDTRLAEAVTAGFAQSLNLTTTGFQAFGSLAPGGLSNIWGAAAVPFDAESLAAFPCDPEDLQDSYRRVGARIGVSAPANLAPPIRALHRRSPPRDEAVELLPASNAVLDEGMDGRAACNQCGLCLWGCARDSIYSSVHDLEKLRRYACFSYRGGQRVRAVRPLTPHGYAIDIEGSDKPIVAPRVILAAGAISSTALALATLGRFDVDVRLLSNPVAAMAFLVPGLFGADLPDRTFGLAQMQHRVRTSDGGSAVGMLYAADTLPLGTLADRLPFSRPLAIRVVRALAPALVLATIYLPGEYSRNRLRLTRVAGDTRVSIVGENEPAAVATLRESARRLARHMRRRGAYAIPTSLTISEPGSDAHYAGTLPLGGHGSFGCSAEGELNGAPNLYVVDGAVLPILPAEHCTLTIMANADRIGRALVSHVRAGARAEA